MVLKDALTRGLDYRPAAEAAYAEFAEKSLNLRDIFLLPSVVSISGLALVTRGARHIDTLEGVNQIAAGRSFDLFDGFLARALNQETDLGSMVDAGADKLALSIMIAAAWKHDVVPKPILATTAASNAANALLTTAAAVRHPEANYRPTPSGKDTMALLNASIISHAYASALENERADARLHEPLRLVGNATFALGAAKAAITACQYAKRL